MDKYYKLLYWGYNADEPTTDVSRSADVTVPPETLMAMLGPLKPPFYKFIAEDGQDWYIAANRVEELLEVYPGEKEPETDE